MGLGYGSTTITNLSGGSVTLYGATKYTQAQVQALIQNGTQNWTVASVPSELHVGDDILIYIYLPDSDIVGCVVSGKCGAINSSQSIQITNPKFIQLKGDTGVGVSSIVHYYYLSTSSTTQTGGSWGTNVPVYVSGRYYWTRQKITYTDGMVIDTTPVLDNGLTDANWNAHSASTTADEAKALADAVQPELIVGTHGTTATATWTGTSTVLTAIQSGTRIQYKLSSAGASNVTLNLTLANGSTTGAKEVYYSNTSRLSTQYGVGAVIDLIYDGTAWRVLNPYTDSNTIGSYGATNLVAGANGIKQYSLIMKDSSTTWASFTTTHGVATTKLKNTVGFIPDKLYYVSSSSNYADGSQSGTCYDSLGVDLRYSTNCGTTLVVGKPVYIVGTMSANLFYLDDTWWTQTEPTTEDGKAYIYVGIAYNSYCAYLNSENPIYVFYDGRFMTQDEATDLETYQRANPGLAMKINYSAYNTSSSEKVYLHGYKNGNEADVDGYVYWNGAKRTVSKGLINPNGIVPYNKYIYIVLRLTSSTATEGTKYMVWYNSGWKYAVTPTPSAVSGTWTWDDARDIVLGQFIAPPESGDLVEAYLYAPSRSASQVKTATPSPYQYSQSAVAWYEANGSTTVNATTMLAAWADGAFTAETEINGGFIKAHTIKTEHLATNAIMSSKFSMPEGTPSSPFSATGTFLDLESGNLYTPNFGIDNNNGMAYLNGEIIATSGRIGNSAATNYWEIGTKTDYNADTSAALIGHGTSYIQSGNWQLSNNKLNTQKYNEQNKITYLYNDNTYWDFGMQVPELNTSATGFVSGIDDNWLYIRNHASTIPELKTDWNYIFRIDKSGMIYINGVSLDDKYASIDGVGGTYLPLAGGTISGNLKVTGTLDATANKAKQLTHSLTINGTAWDGSSSTTIGTMGVQYGGTGTTTFTSGYALIGNGQNAIQTRAITNNTSATYITGNTNLVTANTLKFWNGAYDTSHNSNLEYVKQGKLGTVVTLDAEDVITTDGGIIDGSLQVTDLTAGNLIVTGAARFTNGLLGDLTGNADTADKVNNNLIIKLNSGTTEGTNMFTFNGSAAKTVDVTKSAIGLGNVENTKLSTWAGSANLTTTKVGTLAAAATKAVDTSISAASTSANLPTSAAVAAFVEGKGYVTSSGVTSVRVQATSPVVSSVNTAQSSTLNTTISLADGYGDTKNPYASKTKSYVLAAPSGENGAPTFRALVADDIPALASKIKLSGTDYSASSNVITITQANLQSAVQSTGLVLMTSAERSKLASIQVAEGGTIDFSGVTASAPLTATVATDKTVTITHNTSGVTAGTYRSVTVNTYGHVTAGTNPTTLSGYGITDAKIANGVITLGGNTITPLTASSTLDATKLSGTASIDTTGNATTATKFSSNRSITLTGDTTGSVSSNGESGWSITTKTDRLTTVGDNRDVATKPNDYVNKIIFQGLKRNNYINSPSSNTYSYLVGLRGWSDSSGGKAHEIAFNDDGIFRRTGSTTDWDAWAKLIDSVNYTDYTVKKDGTGASGTWGISISGNANSSTYPRIVASNELRFDVNTKPSSATTLYVGYKWSNDTYDAKINRYKFCNGNAQAAEVEASMFYGALSGNATSATKATQDSDGNAINATYAKLSGATFTGAVAGTSFGASEYLTANSGSSGTSGGIALYSTNPTTYGIAMRYTSNGGKHGYVQGDWGIYSYMGGADDRGWILKNATRGYNIASISNLGEAVFNGSVTVGGNATNDSGCRMEFNTSTQSLDFIFN